MDGPPPPEEDFSALPIAERIEHKNWKARVSGYEALIKLFQTTASDADPAFRPYLSNLDILKKIVSDANAVAQEKGVEVVVNLVKFSGTNAAKTRDAVLPALVDKCIGSTRSGTRSQATELVLQYVEISNTAADIVPDILNGLQAKQPKVVAGCVMVLKEAIRCFGASVVPPTPILKALPRMFAHTDKTVRSEAMQLAQLVYRNIGSAIEPFLSELKPVQVKELHESFELMDKDGAGKGTFKPERLTRERQQQDVEGASEEHDDATAAEIPSTDPRAFAEEVDVVSQIPGTFYEALGSSKWKDRKEALDDLHTRLEKTLRIKDVPEVALLCKALAARMTDANINCVMSAASCIKALASGLQASFARHREVVLPPMLERLKERKQNVCDSIGAALDATFQTTNLTDCLDFITPALGSKNPQVKEGALKFLHRCLAIAMSPPSISQVKTLSESLVQLLEDGYEGARTEAAMCLGTLMKMVGERPLNAVMEPVADVRRAKVKEAYDQATVKCKLGTTVNPSKNAAQAAQTVTTAQSVAAKPKGGYPLKAKTHPVAVEAGIEEPKTPARTAPAKLMNRLNKPAGESSKDLIKPGPISTVKKAPPTLAVPQSNKGKSLTPSAPSTLDTFKYTHSSEEADSLASELIPPSISTGLSDPNWKARLAALEEMQAWVDSVVADFDSEVVIRFLSKKALSEKNFQVSAKLYGILSIIAERCPSFDRSSVALAVPHLTDKLGDMKLRKQAGDTLLLFAEKTSLSLVLTLAYDPIGKVKAPKVLTDSITWIDQGLNEFGIQGLSLRSLIEFLKAALKNSNAGVRTAATKTLVTLKLFAGSGIKDLLEDLNPQLLTTIHSEFERVEGQLAPVPVRHSADVVAIPSGIAKASGKTDTLDELFPRVDLDKLLAGTTIIADAKSDAWKTRKEALESLQALLDVGGNKRLKPNMGDISQVLKARVLDTNKACQLLALDIISRISTGMNKPFEKYVKFFSTSISAVLADQKANVRSAATTTLSAIAAACEGLEPLVHGLAAGLEAQNPLQRSSLLVWLTEWLSANPPSSHLDLSEFTPPVVACLDDRSVDVRKAAQSFLPFLIANVGFDKVIHETQSLKQASRSAILPLIQAAKASDSTSLVNGEQTQKLQNTTEPSDPLVIPASGGMPKMTGLRSKRIGGAVGATSAVDSRLTPKDVRPKQSPLPGLDTRDSAISQGQAPSPTPFVGSNPDAKRVRLAKDTGRWIFESGPVRKEILDTLQNQMEAHASRELLALLFSTGHNAINDYMTGMSLMSSCYQEATDGRVVESTKLILMSNCDFPLKYACTKMHESQPNLIVKSLDVVDAVVAFLRHVGYQLSDSEAQHFIPTMIHKLGDAREAIRLRVQQLIRALPRIYAYSRIFSLLLDHGLKSKVAKTRQGALDEVGNILIKSGLNACDPMKAFPMIGAMIADKDASVRRSALSVLSEGYSHLGSKIWDAVGQLGPKEKTQLEERLRRAATGVLDGGRSASPAPLTKGSRTASPTLAVAPNQTRPNGTGSRAGSPAPSLRKVVPSSTTQQVRKSHLPSRLAHAPSRVALLKSNEEPPTERQALRPLNGQINTTTSVSHQPTSRHALSSHMAPSSNGGSTSPPSDDTGIIISNILSNDASRSVDALKKIQKILEPSSRENSSLERSFQELAEHSEGLIETVTIQVSHVFDRIDELSEPANFRLAKHLMQTLHAFFAHGAFAEALTVDTIGSLLEELTLRLLETDESSDSNVREISRFINLILLKVFASAKRITVFRALFSLLLKIVKPFTSQRTQADSHEAKVAELVLKCIWKLARNIPSDLDKQQLDPVEMFPIIEQALQSVPPNDWRARSANKVPCGDMPLRTIKVIIQHIVAKYGDQVYDHLSSAFDDPSATIVYPYVYRILNSNSHMDTDRQSKSAMPVSTSTTSLMQQASSRPSSSASSSTYNRRSSSPRRSLGENGVGSGPMPLSPTASLDESDPDNQLLLIIGHISSETTGALHKEGITQLHNFLKAYPHKKAKVDKMLESTGPAFRKYLARALASRAAEDEEREAAVADTLSKLEAVRRDPSSPGRPMQISPRRSSGTSDIASADSDKLSRLHDLFRYRGSGSGGSERRLSDAAAA